MKYTFQDWLDNKFVNERYPDGTFVLNDSSKYAYLCVVGKMDYEVLNDIEDAQAQAYEKMVCNEFDYRKGLYIEQSSTRTEQIKKLVLEDIETYFNSMREIYKAIITNKPTRGSVPIGAKFITPKLTLQPYAIPSLEGSVSNRREETFYDPNLMFDGEIDFVIMEAHIRLKDEIEGKIVGKKFPYHYFTRIPELRTLQFLEDQLITFEKKINLESGEYRWNGTNYDCAVYIDFLFTSKILSRRHEEDAKKDLEKRYSVDLRQQKPNKVRAYMTTDKGKAFTETLNNLLNKIPKEG